MKPTVNAHVRSTGFSRKSVGKRTGATAGLSSSVRRLRTAGQASSGTRSSDLSYNRGFTLLEVMLALAILVGSLAVLGEFARMGLHSARTARDLTRAELLCESLMSEIAAGILPPTAVQAAPIEDPVTGTPVSDTQTDDVAQWVYSVDVQSIDADGLLGVTVTVMQDLPPAQRPATFSLVRWIPDPMLDLLGSSTESDMSNTEP
jgi:prepilin-type N-terminal cleavage/methylation domain-containing protein